MKRIHGAGKSKGPALCRPSISALGARSEVCCPLVPAVRVMLVVHVIAAAESLTEIGALLPRPVRMPEVVVAIGVGRPSRVNVMSCRFNTIMEATVPRLRPVALRFIRRPGTRGRPLLRMNGQ